MNLVDDRASGNAKSVVNEEYYSAEQRNGQNPSNSPLSTAVRCSHHHSSRSFWQRHKPIPSRHGIGTTWEHIVAVILAVVSTQSREARYEYVAKENDDDIVVVAAFARE